MVSHKNFRMFFALKKIKNHSFQETSSLSQDKGLFEIAAGRPKFAAIRRKIGMGKLACWGVKGLVHSVP